MRKNDLIRKIRLITAMHILPNISISNGDQIMYFGQLIEYNMRDIFLEKT